MKILLVAPQPSAGSGELQAPDNAGRCGGNMPACFKREGRTTLPGCCIYDRVPLKAAFNDGFGSRGSLKDIRKMCVRDVTFRRKGGLKISRTATGAWVYERLCDFRAGIAGMISFLKRCFGLRRCAWNGFEFFRSCARVSLITANMLLARHALT